MKKSVYSWSGITRSWVARIHKKSLYPGYQKCYLVCIPKGIIKDYKMENEVYALLTLNIFSTRKDLRKYVNESRNWRACRIKTLKELELLKSNKG